MQLIRYPILIGAMSIAFWFGQTASARADSPVDPAQAEQISLAKSKFLARLSKLQNYSATYTRDDIFPALSWEDHWDSTQRFKNGRTWNVDNRVSKTDAKFPAGIAFDRVEKVIFKDDPKALVPDEVDLLTPHGGGEQLAVTGKAFGTLEGQGMDLPAGLGVLWQMSWMPVTSEDLSKTRQIKYPEHVQVIWARKDDDHVTVTFLDDWASGDERTLTLDRKVGYAVVEAMNQWKGSKDYTRVAASDFKDVGGGFMMPMTIKSLHRSQSCHGDYDALTNTFHITKWTIGDPKNVPSALEVKIPSGVKTQDRKSFEAELVKNENKRVAK